MAENKRNDALGGLFSLILVGVFIWYFFGGGIQNQVAQDQIKQYEIAKNSGNTTDAAVQAGIVAAAYLQAHDEPNYQKWKKIEAEEDTRAGIPVAP